MKGERRFKEVETAERRKLVEHQQQPVALARCGQLLGQPAADLVEDQADERLGAVDVGRRDNEIEADRPFLPPKRDRRCASRSAQ